MMIQELEEDEVQMIKSKQVSAFTFTFLEDKRYTGFNHKDTQDLLYKWYSRLTRGMQNNCFIKRFSYDQHFQEYQIDSFVLDFFNNNPFIKVLCEGGKWGSLGKVQQVQKECTNHSVTSLSFFNRLKNNITRPNGDIIKCLDEYHENFLISDLLRKTLLVQDYDHYELFSATDRQEFIFQLFKSLCLGGRLCQYEDTLQPYLETTRKIYKDLIRYFKTKKGCQRQQSKITRLIASIQNHRRE